MSKFKIELELNDINERILISDYDSSTNSNETLTFNEEVNIVENDVYTLNFSISDNLGRPNISIKSLMNVGRPLWLYTYKPNRAIRMVITSISPVIGSDNVIYNVTANDYASFVFSKNNAGLNLDTINDDNFLNWLEDSTYTEGKIESIGTFILERGWLKNSSGNGWSIDVSLLEEEKQNEKFNIVISNSNTYNALIEIGKLTNTNLKIDYQNKKFIFIGREDSDLDKNYILDRDFNINELGVTYSGENLYTLLYVTGGQNEYDTAVTLSQVTSYGDTFIEPNLDYFVNANLISLDDAETFINTDINTTLKDLNETLRDKIINRFNAEIQINDMRAEIEALAEQIMVTDVVETFSEKYNNLISYFERFNKDESNQETFPITTTSFKTLLNSLPEGGANYTMQFPITVSYDGEIQIVENSTEKISNEFYLFLSDTGSLTEYTQNGISFYIDSSSSTENFTFQESLLNIIQVNAVYSEDITEFVYEKVNPFLEKLDLYNGQDALDKEKERIQDIIDFYKSEWDKDFLHLECLRGNINENPDPCEGLLIPEDENVKNGLIESIIQRIESYKLVIGSYQPRTNSEPSNTELGKFTLIKKIFNDYEQGYTLKTNTSYQLQEYKNAVKAKNDFWYNIKKDRQHLFQEGYYENSSFGLPEQLYLQGEFIYQNHKEPQSSITTSYINISDIISKDIEEIEVGDFIHIREEKINFFNEETKLKVAGITKNLRNDKNISLNIFRYNLYDNILERIMALSQ